MRGSAPQPPRRWRPNTTAGQLLLWGVQQCKFHARSTVRARAPPRAAAARLQTLESVNRESGKEPAKGFFLSFSPILLSNTKLTQLTQTMVQAQWPASVRKGRLTATDAARKKMLACCD